MYFLMIKEYQNIKKLIAKNLAKNLILIFNYNYFTPTQLICLLKIKLYFIINIRVYTRCFTMRLVLGCSSQLATHIY